MQAGTPLDTRIRDAYLARLGFEDVPPPTAEALVALHRAQVERVPYETLWIALGEQRGIDLLGSVRIITDGTGAGGYCYHLNGAFSVLLEWLGFDVHRHFGGVRPKPSKAMPDPQIGWGNHLAMTVELDGHPWMVDAGLGDAIHEPIPLVEGDVTQGPFTFHVRPSTAEPGGWHLDHHPTGSFLSCDFRPGPVTEGEFVERHTFLSTSPESGFVRVVTAQRRDATGVDALRGKVLTRQSAEPESTRELVTEAEWRDVLADVFGMPLAHLDPAAVSTLWARICADHEAFLARES
jgi:N-hydroxyarylamine O-acetyltransferase